jgi:troponin T, fast skeletal muscle
VSAVKQKEPETQELTEGEKAMLEAKKRHQAEEEAKMLDYEEKRKQEMEQLQKELAELRDQQRRRLEERKQVEAELAARHRQDEERRRKEEVKIEGGMGWFLAHISGRR